MSRATQETLALHLIGAGIMIVAWAVVALAFAIHL